jgi:hypothetical protein
MILPTEPRALGDSGRIAQCSEVGFAGRWSDPALKLS